MGALFLLPLAGAYNSGDITDGTGQVLFAGASGQQGVIGATHTVVAGHGSSLLIAAGNSPSAGTALFEVSSSGSVTTYAAFTGSVNVLRVWSVGGTHFAAEIAFTFSHTLGPSFNYVRLGGTGGLVHGYTVPGGDVTVYDGYRATFTDNGQIYGYLFDGIRALLPDTPTSLRVWNETAALNLSWSAPPAGHAPLGYVVTRTNATSSLSTVLGLATSWRDVNVSRGHTYNYTVRAWNADGNGTETSPQNGTSAVANLTAYESAGVVNLSWSSTTAGPWGLLGYNVYRNGVRVATNQTATYYVTDTSAAVYAVRWNASNDEGPAATWTLGGGPALTARGFREKAFLYWDAGGLSNPISFALYRGTSPDALVLYQTFAGNVRATQDPMTPGQVFFYAVRVANATQTSPNSTIVRVAYTPPPPPIYGDNGQIYGGDKAYLAATVGISPTALGILYGIIFVVGFAGFAAARKPTMLMAGAGAGVGTVFSTYVGFFPAWFVAFLVVISAAIFLALRIRRGNLG